MAKKKAIKKGDPRNANVPIENVIAWIGDEATVIANQISLLNAKLDVVAQHIGGDLTKSREWKAWDKKFIKSFGP